MLHPFEKDVFLKDFKEADLQDNRLTSRLHCIAAKMSNKPNCSIPMQMENWTEAKACYRFFNNQSVTHKRIQSPHRERIKKEASKIEEYPILFIQDLSELDYSSQKATKGLGQAGNQYGKGIQMHSCLAVKLKDENAQVLGLAHQIVWERKEKKSRSKPKVGEQFRGESESEIWSQTLRGIGRPPKNCRWITVCDRGCDAKEFFFDAKELGWDFVARIYRNREVKIQKEDKKLIDWIKSLTSQGAMTITTRKQGETKAREINLQVTYATEIRLSKEDEEMEISVVRCWNEEENIDWVLANSLDLRSLEESVEIIKWYAHRWIIEEYHKCVKTGCKVETRQLGTSRALESIVGVLGVIAILMLTLRDIARDAGEEAAENFVPIIAVKIICKRFKLDRGRLTINQFWRCVAGMGGFLNRKSDGQPGWQSLWEGWLRLFDMMEGINIFLND